MRDINICKKCKYYEEDVMKLISEYHGFKKEFVYAALGSTHWCMTDYDAVVDNPVRAMMRGISGMDEQLSEYHALPLPKTCPYYAEQTMASLYPDNGKVRIHWWRRMFRMIRHCQHCGKEIPDVKTCPSCGYDRFKAGCGVSRKTRRIWCLSLAFNIAYAVWSLILAFILLKHMLVR